MRARVCAVIIAKNEERRLPGCIGALRWCDSVWVFDSGSTDRTVEVARELGATVICLPFHDFSSLRNAALDSLDTDCEWIFFVDADERVSPELADEITSVCARDDPDYAAWTVNRWNYLLGRRVKHSGWSPDNTPRLFRRGKVRYGEHLVHEEPIVDGSIGGLTGPLLHYSCEKVSDLVRKLDLYSDLEAKTLSKRQTRPIEWRRFPSPRFFKSVCRRVYDRCPFMRAPTLFSYYYFLKLGFLDGYRGFLIAAVHGLFHGILTNAKAWEMGGRMQSTADREMAGGMRKCA